MNETSESRGPNMGGLMPTNKLGLTMLDATPNVRNKSKFLTVNSKWRQHERNLAKLKDSLFLLLAHPDATDKEIAAARTIAMETHRRTLELRKQMQAHGYFIKEI